MTTSCILKYDEPLAYVDLVDGKLVIRPTKGNERVVDLIEGLRPQPAPNFGMVLATDEELFASLKYRLTGRIWAGEITRDRR